MGKNIVVCCDGTGNDYGQNNTNVVCLYELLVRDTQQIAFYDPGVGTFSFLGRTLGKKVGTLMGLGFGYGLQQNIEDAYEYLMNRFEPGDKLFLFGFSRGAFTVRALAGMLYKCGLLQKGSKNLIPYASQIYNTRGNKPVAEGFKQTYCQECKPHFIGVWDTVGSMGKIYATKRFLNPRLTPDITYGYHAIAIDEKRKKFPVSIWNEDLKQPHQTIEQVWFAGVHSDVGGWYKDRSLSDIALEWMLDRAENPGGNAGQGIRLQANWRNQLNPNPLGKMHESRTGIWRVWRPVTRKIQGNAVLHPSVIERTNSNLSYKPKLPEK